MVDLFTVALSSFCGVIFDKALGKAIDVITTCPTCEQEDGRKIKNGAANFLECSNCHALSHQVTNACESTVNVNSKVIGQGKLFQTECGVKIQTVITPQDVLRQGFTYPVDCSGLHWDKRCKTKSVSVPLEGSLIDMKNRSVICRVYFRLAFEISNDCEKDGVLCLPKHPNPHNHDPVYKNSAYQKAYFINSDAYQMPKTTLSVSQQEMILRVANISLNPENNYFLQIDTFLITDKNEPISHCRKVVNEKLFITYP